ncbi:MAG: DUF4105 domain-containing protein [Gammaproteobacteria bacterium]|nr:DUF4105 domain-containing protein [Gammaproteobacteria bacterium]
MSPLVHAGEPAARKPAIDTLAAHDYWWKLGHWQEGWFGTESAADNEGFFIAADGRHDPAAELRTMLAALRSERRLPASDEMARCRFPARTRWLAQQLGEDFGSFSECPSFAEWYGEINPGSMSLIFPAAYLNNPASMYGHTLLRIDPPGQSMTLASYAVNFAAQTVDSNGLVFAVKGLTGMYAGTFGVMPYYRKVKDYGDIENRDIWEYPLALEPVELERIMLHLWELESATFDYYFFDENCSYQLLSLLELANDDLQLLEDYRYQVIPADTVKQIIREIGIAGEPVFRPSLATRLEHQAGLMSEAALAASRDIVAGRLTPAALPAMAAEEPQVDARQVLDQAYDWLQYRHNVEGGTQQLSGPAGLAILRARADLPSGQAFSDLVAPDTAPESGHAAARWTAYAGELEAGAYQGLRLRAAYHDLLDPGPGYTPGAAITMFALDFRRYEDATPTGDNWQLERFDLVDIQSYSPRTRLFTPKSWELHAGFNRDYLLDPATPLAFDIGGSLGASWAARKPGSFVYAGLGGELLYSRDFVDGTTAWRAGPLLQGRWQLAPSLASTLRLESQWSEGVLSQRRDLLSLELGWTPGKALALRAAYQQQRRAAVVTEHWQLAIQAYW